MFTGLSTLRAKEKDARKAAPSEKALQLQAYLAKYTGGGSAPEQEKKKRKKKRPPAKGNIQIVDTDASGFKSVTHEEADDDEEGPVVANAEEAERLARLAQKERAGLALQGWETVGGGATAGRSCAQNGAGDAQEEDASPPRRSQLHSPDASPPRRGRAPSSPDASPPRRPRHDSPDASPFCRARQTSPDASPPRRVRHDSPDASLPRRARHDRPDASPPRRTRHDSTDKQTGATSDVSPPRRAQRASPEDVSPPRRAAGKAKRSREEGAGPGVEPSTKGGPVGKHMRKGMLDGTLAGLVTGRELMSEMDAKRKAEAARLAALGAGESGRGAATVYRDKTGKAMDAAEAARLREAERKPEPVKPEWGGGLKQREAAAEARVAMAAEAAKPFARTADDADLEAQRRAVVRFGDPMAHLVARRAGGPAPPPPVLPPAMARQLRKHGGFVVPQEVPPHSWLLRKLGPPANRYGIRPGRHWDGVDRSNGFERDLFKTQAARVARDSEAHMWSQADM